MLIQFKRIDKLAVIPTRAHEWDAGADLVAISKTYDPESGCLELGTGLAISIPNGYVGLIFPRSSIYKTNLSLSNSVGVIDSGYTGEIKFKFRVLESTKEYKVGDKVGQLVVMPILNTIFQEVDNLNESSRGSGGFGSTGV